MTALLRLFKTTTFRLSLLYMLLFAAAASLAIGYIYWNTNVLIARQLNETVRAEIQGLAEQYTQGGLDRLAATVAERSLTPGDSLYLLTDPSGARIAGNLKKVSRTLWDQVGRVEFIYRRPAPGGTEQRFAYASVFRLSNGHRLIVGRDIEGRRDFERVVRSVIFWGIGFMALVGFGGGWIVSRNLLSRINTVTETSRSIMAGDLAQRIPLRGSGDELDRLSENLNAMLERIESLMNGLKEVSDNIAHDLKTPLTRLRNRAEAVLRDENSQDDYRYALETTIEEADELIKTFNSLLAIARLEAGSVWHAMAEVDLSVIVGEVIELYDPVAEAHDFRLVEGPLDKVSMKGDRQLLGQALANLIENALKYGDSENKGCGIGLSEQRERNKIQLGVKRSGQFVEIVVADHGPGIPDHLKERAKKRFVRLEESRSQPGSGLGLSLVSAVARLHGGQLDLEDNNPGLKAIIRLPLKRAQSDVMV